MTETPVPYDAGLHVGFHFICRCGDFRIGTLNGQIYLLPDDGGPEKVPRKWARVIRLLAETVDYLRDEKVASGRINETSGPSVG